MNIKLGKSKRTIIPSLIMSSYVVAHMKNSSQLEIKCVYSKNKKNDLTMLVIIFCPTAYLDKVKSKSNAYTLKSKMNINNFTVKIKSKEIKCVYSKSKQKKNQMRKTNIKLEKIKNELLYLHSYFMSSYVVTHMKNSSQLEIKCVYSKNQKQFDYASYNILSYHISGQSQIKVKCVYIKIKNDH